MLSLKNYFFVVIWNSFIHTFTQLSVVLSILPIFSDFVGCYVTYLSFRSMLWVWVTPSGCCDSENSRTWRSMLKHSVRGVRITTVIVLMLTALQTYASMQPHPHAVELDWRLTSPELPPAGVYGLCCYDTWWAASICFIKQHQYICCTRLWSADVIFQRWSWIRAGFDSLDAPWRVWKWFGFGHFPFNVTNLSSHLTDVLQNYSVLWCLPSLYALRDSLSQTSIRSQRHEPETGPKSSTHK